MQAVDMGRPAGLAGALWGAISQRLSIGATGVKAQKQLRIVESLALGPKQKLFLVSCAEERFLVATGVDSVQSVVRIAGAPVDGEAR